ncbi:hypothetical protein V8F33_000899 [Rhypophila sp. PSN 637]
MALPASTPMVPRPEGRKAPVSVVYLRQVGLFAAPAATALWRAVSTFTRPTTVTPIPALPPAPAVAAEPEPARPPPPPPQVWIPPIDKPGPGIKDADFKETHHWDSTHRRLIGNTTRHIKFGPGMKLTDTHILTILAFGPRVCKKLLSFTVDFSYTDDSYKDHNAAFGISNSSLVALARACPSLSKVTIQSARNVGDVCLLTFYQHCPRLNFIEIRGYSCEFTETAFAALRNNPDWMPKLKKLRLSFSEHDKPVMKAMREVGKLRETLVVTSVSTSEYKKWGDWVTETYEEHWKKGRKWDPPVKSGPFLDDIWW